MFDNYCLLSVNGTYYIRHTRSDFDILTNGRKNPPRRKYVQKFYKQKNTKFRNLACLLI